MKTQTQIHILHKGDKVPLRIINICLYKVISKCIFQAFLNFKPEDFNESGFAVETINSDAFNDMSIQFFCTLGKHDTLIFLHNLNYQGTHGYSVKEAIKFYLIAKIKSIMDKLDCTLSQVIIS